MKSNNLGSPVANSTAELIDSEGELNVKYRLHQWCCGSKRRLLIILLVSLLVVGAVATLTYFLTRIANSTAELIDSEGELNVKYRLHQWCCGSKRRLLIILLVSLLVVGAVATLTYFLTRKPKICVTPLCYNISREISNQLDKSVDPCDDFYSYACGGFFKKHQLGANQSKVDSFSLLNKDNMNVLRRALQNITNYKQNVEEKAPFLSSLVIRQTHIMRLFQYIQSSSIMKTAKIYNSCLNASAIDNRGAKPLIDLIEQYGGWSVTGNGLNQLTVNQKMGRILRDLNVQTLLPVSVITDLLDSSHHILKFSPSTLGMSPSYYTADSPESKKIRLAYQTYMKTIARLLGGGFVAQQKMMDIYNFEKKLVNAMTGSSYSEDLIETLRQYHRSGRSLDTLDKTISEFSDKSGFSESFILNYLDAAFLYQGITFSSSDKVFYVQDRLGDAPIYQGISNAYYGTTDEVVKNYMMWQVVSRYVTAMPQQFVEAKLKYATAVLGVQEYERWSACLGTIMTPMEMSLGRLYVDADFDESTVETVKDMTKRIRKSFTDNLKSEDWMDSSTKSKAKEKANAIAEDVGYPSFIKDDNKLDAHYSMLTVVEDYFENTMAMNKMLIQKQFGTYQLPVNKDKWAMGPTTINAYYSPQQNKIVILAGILHSPFYKKRYPKYFNYGSLAMIIGHEITHGFDGTGRLFDKNGNARDWWSFDSALNFQSRSNCLVNQYGNYEVFGKYINGIQTLNENIADNGGIKLAYDAYNSWVDDNEKEGQLPDLDLSVDQLFFIGFAMPWCSVYKKQAALFQLKSDVHSYNKYRVIGSLSNFKRFSKAFSCSSGSAMNPEDKCAVW